MLLPDYIKLMPLKFGVGIVSTAELPVPACVAGLRQSRVGLHNNYYVTKDTPELHQFQIEGDHVWVIDAFSPNLNKRLHVGHLRSVAIMAAFSRILPCEFVSMLGASLGELPNARSEYLGWCKMAGVYPRVWDDVSLVSDFYARGSDINYVKIGEVPGTGKYEGCKVVPNLAKDGEWVVTRKSDGSSTYALHDLLFYLTARPDYYLTGQEQADHFKSIGLGDKHLPMGLVLDPKTGQKMKSRDGNALAADEALDEVVKRLSPSKMDPKHLGWNVISYNLLKVSRESNVKFDVDAWIKPESPGLYVTYTYARVRKALSDNNFLGIEHGGWTDPTQEDINLRGYASALALVTARAAKKMDPAPVAVFAYDLAKLMNGVYNTERISSGRPELILALNKALLSLGKTMTTLGMYTAEEV